LKQHANAPDLAGQPFALTENVKGASVIAALDREACALGLSAGMKLADARALEPDLAVFDADPLADAKLLEHMAMHCERYTPAVAIRAADHRGGALILDMRGAMHLYAGKAALMDLIEADFYAQGYTLRHAFAPTADAAFALARHGLKAGAEMQLPVSALGLEERPTQALERAGLYSVGDLAHRPRAPLAARFGADMVTRLERILGETDQIVDPIRSQTAVRVERRFAEPIGHIDSVMQVLEELFGDAAALLEERKQGARLITMRLFRSDGHIAPLQIETGAPTRDAALFKRLLAERVDSLNDPLDPGFGYDLLRLSVPLTEDLFARQITLDGERDTDADEAALLSQLSIRLGRENLHRFAPADSHIPEHALSSRAALEPALPFIWEAPQRGEPPQRPLFLFDPPQRISVMAEVPDGPPRRFVWKRQTYLVTRAEGPERIASEWWRRREGYKTGKAGLTRDYYRVEDSEGRRFWLLRRGLYGAEARPPEWYVHGTFA